MNKRIHHRPVRTQAGFTQHRAVLLRAARPAFSHRKQRHRIKRDWKWPIHRVVEKHFLDQHPADDWQLGRVTCRQLAALRLVPVVQDVREQHHLRLRQILHPEHIALDELHAIDQPFFTGELLRDSSLLRQFNNHARRSGFASDNA